MSSRSMSEKALGQAGKRLLCRSGKLSGNMVGPLNSARRAPLAMALVLCLVCCSLAAAQQIQSGTLLPPEKLVYPVTQLCLLDLRGEKMEYPFKIKNFKNHLLALLRSEDYLKVRTEQEVENVLLRNRISVPELYDPAALNRICRITDSNYTAYLRLITTGISREDGFTIPVLFHRNKVTYSAVLDLALFEGKTGSLSYSRRIEGKKSLGRGMQVFPVTYDDPSLHLDYQQKEALALETMQDLARRTFDALLYGMHKPLGVKYICYWGEEVHIISDKPGFCPVCGSRLIKVVR